MLKLAGFASCSPGNNDPALILRRCLNKGDGKLEIQYTEPDMQATFSTLIVDRKYLLAVEYKDGAKSEPRKSTGMATYSNSEATIMSYTSIFDTLWIRGESDGRKGSLGKLS